MFDKRFYQLECCKLRYSLRDPDTFKLLTIYENIPTKAVIKTAKGDIEVYKELTLLLSKCHKCGAQTARIYRFDKDMNIIIKGSEKHVMQVSGKNLTEHLTKIEDNKILLTPPEPIAPVLPTLDYIPMVYYVGSKESGLPHYLGGNNARTKDAPHKSKVLTNAQFKERIKEMELHNEQ